MLSDLYKPLTNESIEKVYVRGQENSLVGTPTEIFGWIQVLNGNEVEKSKQLKLNATARLYTNEELNVTDRITDTCGYFSTVGTKYEIVFNYRTPNGDETHKRYDLKVL